MYYICIIISVFVSILFPQDIKAIEIQGNLKTKEYIILREINQKINEPLNPENVINDQNRIYNIGLFSLVKIEAVDSIYQVQVNEKWFYVVPFPIIKYDNQSEKFSYGAGIQHSNFRGRNENIATGATAGNIREYFFWYENPWISGDHNSLEIGLYNESSDHHVYNILEKDKGFFAGGGFFKGYNHKFDFSFNYNNKLIETLDNPESDKDTLELEHLTQTDFLYIRLGSDYKYDTRDIHIDPSSGIFFNIKLNNIFGFKDTQNIYAIETHFNIYKNLFRSYFNPVFRYKFFGQIQYSDLNIPVFKKEYIGGQGYIRGYSPIPSNNTMDNSREMLEVDNLLINTIEIQSTLIKRKEYLEKVEMGVDFVLFADWGVGYNLNEFINFNNSLVGYGLGLRIFIMGGLIKIDYGFNSKGTSHLHLF